MIKLSLIVPTYNRADSLKLTVDSICSQTISPDVFELLIIDNNSTDNTKVVSEAAIAAFPEHNIRYIFEPIPGLLSGRHRGTSEAKGDILVFVDDDIEADKGWLEAIKDAFAYPTVQLVGGRNLPRYESDPPAWLQWFWAEQPGGISCGYLSLVDLGEEVMEIGANFVWGLNFSIRRSALVDLGGFHPDCMPKHLQHFQGDGETGLTMKANERAYKAVYQPKALLFHHVPSNRMTLEYFDSRCFYQGVCNSFTDIRRQYGLYKIVTKKTGMKETLIRKLVHVKMTTVNILRKKTAEEVLIERFHNAYLDGYRFHQESVKKYPALLKWVLKENYWDYKLPDLTIEP